MELPEHIEVLIVHAREKRAAFCRGEIPMHESSNATVAARSALAHWLMDVIHRSEQAAA